MHAARGARCASSLAARRCRARSPSSSTGSIDIFEGYGMTEAGPVITVNARASCACRLGSVGQPIPEVEVKVRDPDGEGVGEVPAARPACSPPTTRTRSSPPARCRRLVAHGDLGRPRRARPPAHRFGASRTRSSTRRATRSTP
ncbi:MAG: AMP-binding protein [Planctomycetota bacterium]|nr:AMP-binding protein [Planctomycetota bacterium]